MNYAEGKTSYRIEKIIDREEDIEIFKKNIFKSSKTQVQIIYANSGIGKSSFSQKLINENEFSSWETIRIVTDPESNTRSPYEGQYIDMLFDEFMKHFNSIQFLEDLKFEKYISSNENKLIKNIAYSEAMTGLSAPISTSKIKHLSYKNWFARLFNLGSYNPYAIANDNSMLSRSVKVDYIRYVFSYLKTERLLVIIDNIQNIDTISLGYLIDLINDVKNENHVFVFEYTTSSANNTQSLIKFASYIEKNGGVNVALFNLKKTENQYLMEILNNNLDEFPQSVSFSVKAVEHYEAHSSGNLWDLLDFARGFDTIEELEQNNPTLTLLNKLSGFQKIFISIIISFGGRINRNTLFKIWTKYIDLNEEIDLYKLINTLLFNDKIKESDDKKYLLIKHAWISDTWKANRSVFMWIDDIVEERLEKLYMDCYLGKENIMSSKKAWAKLLQIYSVKEPQKIAELLDDFKDNVLINISREQAWAYIKAFIMNTKEQVEKYIETYFKILKLCYSIFLYAEGFWCIEIMEKHIDVNKEPKLMLHKLLYLSILDRQEEVIKIYNDILPQYIENSREWVCLKLVLLNCFIALGQKDECWIIHKELKAVPNLKKTPEYAIYLRLSNIYMPPQKALKNALKSIKIFSKLNDSEQEGKSWVTYSKLLSSIGKQEKAIIAIKKAEQLLKSCSIQFPCIYNNLAGYLLLSDDCSPAIWTYLDISEKCSVSTYDKLSSVLNKLAWCYENKAYEHLDVLEDKALELISKEPNKLIHCTTYYNLQLIMKDAGFAEKGAYYFQLADNLKHECPYVKARIDGLSAKNKYIKHRIKKPYHICYLSFWVFDLQI